jgi:hypothetical protein
VTAVVVVHYAIVDDSFVDHVVAREFTCMLSLQTPARMCVQAVLAPLVRIETMASALMSVQTVLPMTCVVNVACTNIVLRAPTHVSTRPVTASAATAKVSSSAGATATSACVSRFSSTPAAAFCGSFMFVSCRNNRRQKQN